MKIHKLQKIRDDGKNSIVRVTIVEEGFFRSRYVERDVIMWPGVEGWWTYMDEDKFFEHSEAVNVFMAGPHDKYVVNESGK